MRKRKAPQEPRPPKIPGIRYVKQTAYDVEATTVDGETTYRQVPRTVWVPVPPRDWDAVVARALVCAAVLGTLLSVAWSTDSIGHLLNRTGSTVTAYCVAIVFDAVWLGCQAREWLDRREPERARTARNAGYVFLVVAMAAIFANGYEAGETVAGAGGAAVSALAKCLWVLALGYYAVPLDEGTAHHLLTRRRRLTVRLALGAERRRLAAAEAYERLLYGEQGGGDVQVTRYEATPPAPSVPPASAPVSLPPVHYAPSPAPAGDTPAPVSPQVPLVPAPPVPPMSTPAADTSTPVSPPLSPGVPSTPPQTPAPPPAVPPAEPAPEPRPALRVVDGQQTKTGLIRDVLKERPDITLDELTELVREAFGDKPNLRKDVGRLRRRIEGQAS